MEKRNTILLTVVAIATLLVTVISATFAYFASNIQNNGKVGMNVNTSNNQASFIATSSGSLNIDVQSYMMQQHDADPGNQNTSNNETIANLLTANATLNVSLTASDNEHETECSYDIIYTWTGSDSNFAQEYSNAPKSNGVEEGRSITVYPSKYYVRTPSKIEEGFKELTIEIDDEDVYVGNKEGERTYSSETLKETNIDELKPISTDNGENKTLILKEGETISSVSTSQASHVDYLITVRFYNLGTNQDKLMSKKFNGVVSIANIKC